MALQFLDNISYKGRKPNFERDLFQTLDDMKNFSENYVPDMFVASCVETGKVYVFNRTNTVDSSTGKWRELSGGSVSPDDKPAPTPVKDKYYYYGTSATDTIADLTGLTKVKLELANTEVKVSSMAQYIVIAVPQAGGNISIYDENGMKNNDNFIKSTISDGTEDYDVYISDSPIFCTDFVYLIKY